MAIVLGFRWRCCVAAVHLAFLASCASTPGRTRPVAEPILVSGDARFTWIHDAAGIRPVLQRSDVSCAAPSAASVFLLTATRSLTQRFDIEYQTIHANADGSMIATGTLDTPDGSTIVIRDTWAVDGEGFELTRDVTVTQAAREDLAFAIGFELAAPETLTSLDHADIFIPGIWYDTADHTPASGLIHDVGQRDFLLREDRMPLPLVSLRDRSSGVTLTLTHPSPDGATIVADDTDGRLIDTRLRFGSLGVIRTAGAPLRVAFRFPGSEGEQTSIRGYKKNLRTAERLHPMIAGATQHTVLVLRLSDSSSCAMQMRDAWRDAYARARPLVVPFDATAVNRACVGVLEHFAFEQGTIDFGLVAGFPFSVTIPAGVVHDRSLQMGFVGQQLPCAACLIDEGIRASKPQLMSIGERIVDFWARESLSEAGVPRTWFDLDPAPHWRRYDTYLRVATDGTSGMLRAWNIEHAAGRDKPAWLSYCRAVGDWLSKIQNADGSFYRSWSFEGAPVSKSITSTLHPVRLLVELSRVTGESKYRDEATRAATFALANNTNGVTYVGGTPDNPDVIDKEAGWIAFDSYLALYEATKEKRWLDAAVNAATFTETWMYAWNVPMPCDANANSGENVDHKHGNIPRIKTTAGASLIATGHSGADLFLAYASTAYFRLAIATGDRHFADVAQLLQSNTAQFIDLDGNLGYASPGLCVEAFTLAVNRGHSVGTWLPWETAATLEAMGKTREAFGVIDLGAAKGPSDSPNDRRARTTP